MAFLNPPAPGASCTKLGLKRASDEIGTWTTVKAEIAAVANVQEEWGLETQIRAQILWCSMITIVGLTDAQDDLRIRASVLVREGPPGQTQHRYRAIS
ncbi:hypothetical protein [Bradyrhizobium sp. RD5-C2]|uniref:hypothetical protein n=1 Tax=Bradyrhizobium sp. RD5-C2 TaxID=244562 RepID=UPI001CC338D6|nr:hypothetical protein [Bradyrhizobium sp. RD5-C2]